MRRKAYTIWKMTVIFYPMLFLSGAGITLYDGKKSVGNLPAKFYRTPKNIGLSFTGRLFLQHDLVDYHSHPVRFPAMAVAGTGNPLPGFGYKPLPGCTSGDHHCKCGSP